MKRYLYSTALTLVLSCIMPLPSADGVFIYKSAQAQQYLNGVPVPQVMPDGKPIPDWINASCCGPKDVHKLRPEQVHQEEDGTYRVDGYVGPIPHKAAQPSQDGDYWIFYKQENDYQSPVYCFFVPMEF